MATGRYKSKVIPKEMQKDDLFLRQVVIPACIGKLKPNKEGPYRIFQKLPYGAYKLEEVDGRLIPRT